MLPNEAQDNETGISHFKSHDSSGESVQVTQIYTPNAGDGLKRLGERQVWDEKYAEYLHSLDQEKPVLATGDYNVAHKEIDLAHPNNNHESPGFTDTFRHLHSDLAGVYTWWGQRVRTSKLNNSGWRIDYWLVSNRLADKVVKSEMIDSGERQDHTPIVLENFQSLVASTVSLW